MLSAAKNLPPAHERFFAALSMTAYSDLHVSKNPTRVARTQVSTIESFVIEYYYLIFNQL